MKVNQAAFDAGQLAERMAQGYFVHVAAIEVATDPRASALAPIIEAGQYVPVGYVSRKDGTRHAFHFQHFLDQARTNSAIVDDLARTWLVGALLAVGDVLDQNDYFDHAPELELLRDLRNGIAHGNKFYFMPERVRYLAITPGHNKL